jgi:hypothetical protein
MSSATNQYEEQELELIESNIEVRLVEPGVYCCMLASFEKVTPLHSDQLNVFGCPDMLLESTVARS